MSKRITIDLEEYERLVADSEQLEKGAIKLFLCRHVRPAIIKDYFIKSGMYVEAAKEEVDSAEYVSTLFLRNVTGRFSTDIEWLVVNDMQEQLKTAKRVFSIAEGEHSELRVKVQQMQKRNIWQRILNKPIGVGD